MVSWIRCFPGKDLCPSAVTLVVRVLQGQHPVYGLWVTEFEQLWLVVRGEKQGERQTHPPDPSRGDTFVQSLKEL